MKDKDAADTMAPLALTLACKSIDPVDLAALLASGSVDERNLQLKDEEVSLCCRKWNCRHLGRGLARYSVYSKKELLIRHFEALISLSSSTLCSFHCVLMIFCRYSLLCVLSMVQGATPLHGVCWNKNSELLKLLVDAKLIDQDMLKISNNKVRVYY